MKVPASGEAAKTPGGWAFSSLFSQETLLPSCPTRACPLQLQSPQAHSSLGRPLQLLLTSPASGLSQSQLPIPSGPPGAWVHQGRS